MPAIAWDSAWIRQCLGISYIRGHKVQKGCGRCRNRVRLRRGLPTRHQGVYASQGHVSAWENERSTGLLSGIISFYKFTRPHTMLGTFLSICSVSVLSMYGQTWDPQCWTALCTALTAALLANISIVGLNQCFDVEVDRVNKPYLPLASGEWTLSTGWAVVAFTGAKYALPLPWTSLTASEHACVTSNCSSGKKVIPLLINQIS